jgi:acyl carrier protein
MATIEDPRAVLAAALLQVAPDVDLSEIADDAELRAEAELDSLDFLNVIAAIHHATGIEIPERDYPQLDSIAGFINYLESRSS